jgi:outer membrane protein OmpA-like peptidoglycan-associated protein
MRKIFRMTSSMPNQVPAKPWLRVSANSPKIITTLVCVVFSAGCATTQGQNPVKETFASDDPCSNNAANIGTVIGAVVGGVIGNQVKHNNIARILAAGVGATVGRLIGADMDRRRCELSKIAKANGLDMQVAAISSWDNSPTGQKPTNQSTALQTETKDVGLRVAIRDNGKQFQSGSAELSDAARGYFRQIADQYSFAQQARALKPTASKEERDALEPLKTKRILLIGHTDDVGSSQLNADLSERRARAVAMIFQERGIAVEQLFFQGAGETLPIGDNRTDDGRALNRRVEIVDLTNEDAFRAYLASRQPKIEYYRPTAANEIIAASKTSVPTPNKAKPSASIPRSANSTTGAEGPASASQIKGEPNATGSATPYTLDFGGQRVAVPPSNVDIGKLVTSTTFSIIGEAHADESPIANCTLDRPRISHGVKSLKDNKEYSTADYLPGVYDSSWAAKVNGHLVALTNVAVLRDGGSPAHKPKLLVYSNYSGDASATPIHSGLPEVNAYQGDKALLYRVFNSGPIRCMDIVIPNTNPREAPASALFYERSNTLYTAALNLRLAK